MKSEKSAAISVINEAGFRKEIKTDPALAYLLYGEEDYLKAFAVKTAEDILCPDEVFRVFNCIRFDAFTYSPQALADALQSVPMGAEKKLIVISGLDVKGMKKGEIEELCSLIDGAERYPYNVILLHLAAGSIDEGYSPDRPSPALAALAQVFKPVLFERSSPQKLAAWAKKHFEHEGVTVSDALCAKVVEYCGKDMFVLANEIEKICYYVLAKGRSEVTLEDISTAAIANVEFDAFALSNAILASDKKKAFNILKKMRSDRIEPLNILGEVSRIFCDMYLVFSLSETGKSNAEIAAIIGLHPYAVGLYRRGTESYSKGRLKSILDSCADADRTLKSSPTGYAEIEKLIAIL